MVLDQNLANYIFFPLSHLFRQEGTLPTKAIEISLKCMQILISNDWCRRGGVELCKQVMMLLNFLIGGKSIDVKSYETNEDVSIVALGCFASLFQTTENSVTLFEKSTEADDTLALGHTVTVILKAFVDSPSSGVQFAATNALRSLVSCVQDTITLCKFLPGIVSHITKVLQPRGQSSRSYKVLEGALGTMSLILYKTMATCQLAQRMSSTANESTASTKQSFRYDSNWLEATAAKIKLAMGNVVHLKYHDRIEVVEALFKTCMVILRDCRETLANTASLALETVISICARSEIGDDSKKIHIVHSLLALDASLVDTLLVMTCNWVSTLPNFVQSVGLITHAQHISQISAAYHVLASIAVNMDMLDNSIGAHLCEAVVAAINISKLTKVKQLPIEARIDSSTIDKKRDLILIDTSSRLSLVDDNRQGALDSLQNFLKQLKTLRSSTLLKRQFAALLVTASGSDLTACLWLCSIMLDSTPISHPGVNSFIAWQDKSEDYVEEFAELVYTYCFNLLSKTVADDANDWQLQAMAINIFAFRSCQQQQEYRPELVDALYPVVERLGSNHVSLREHAIIALDIIASACNYASSSDLIIQNIDYLVNSIALKLNTFEIRPQDPQVLSMMIKLCGAALIPYLDDLIESIFSALASYHGYPQMVETLFSVLSAVVEESSKSSLPPSRAMPNIHQRNNYQPPSEISKIAEVLRQTQFHDSLTMASVENVDPEEINSIRDKSFEGRNSGNADENDQVQALIVPDERLQRTSKMYSTVQTIVLTSQYYLTHESSNLRRKLLQLTALGCSVLYRNEDEFLPLINNIWPVVVKRLYDPEPYVSISASQTLSNIFQFAGGFVASRVETEWYDICNFYRRVHSRMENENRGKGGRGEFTIAHQLWDALVKMCCKLIERVRISPEVEDQLIDMLAPYARSRSDIHNALNAINPDAVWLTLEVQKQKHSIGNGMKPPCKDGTIFKDVVL